MKRKEKQLAIELRKKGYSYREIREKVPVSKSSLSLWLRSVGLSNRQKQRLTAKKLAAMRRGWEKVYQNRLDRVEKIVESAKNEVSQLIRNPLWLSGVMLYWAEGTKQKIWNPSARVQFNNSAPLMVKIFLQWIEKFFNIKRADYKLELYIHESADIRKSKSFWERTLQEKVNVVYLKRHKISSYRHSIARDYHGLIRITVLRSTNMNRRINGWIEGVCIYCGVV